MLDLYLDFTRVMVKETELQTSVSPCVLMLSNNENQMVRFKWN